VRLLYVLRVMAPRSGFKPGTAERDMEGHRLWSSGALRHAAERDKRGRRHKVNTRRYSTPTSSTSGDIQIEAIIEHVTNSGASRPDAEEKPRHRWEGAPGTSLRSEAHSVLDVGRRITYIGVRTSAINLKE
jgi:hypothetical protein